MARPPVAPGAVPLAWDAVHLVAGGRTGGGRTGRRSPEQAVAELGEEIAVLGRDEVVRAAVLLLGALAGYLARVTTPPAERAPGRRRATPENRTAILAQLAENLRLNPAVVPESADAATELVGVALDGDDAVARFDIAVTTASTEVAEPGVPTPDFYALLLAVDDLAALVDILHERPGTAAELLAPLVGRR